MPEEESVWDYPRPPRLEPFGQHLRVVFNNEVIADTNRGFRVLETSHAPVYYFPPDDVKTDFLRACSEPGTNCEWKGGAEYADIIVGDRRAERAAWRYPLPHGAFQQVAGFWAFYPRKMDECIVGDERAEAQPGDFYGGWVTKNIAGPFKGEPGSEGW